MKIPTNMTDALGNNSAAIVDAAKSSAEMTFGGLRELERSLHEAKPDRNWLNSVMDEQLEDEVTESHKRIVAEYCYFVLHCQDRWMLQKFSAGLSAEREALENRNRLMNPLAGSCLSLYVDTFQIDRSTESLMDEQKALFDAHEEYSGCPELLASERSPSNLPIQQDDAIEVLSKRIGRAIGVEQFAATLPIHHQVVWGICAELLRSGPGLKELDALVKTAREGLSD